MVSNLREQTVEIQVRESVSNGNYKFMAWVSGHHHTFGMGRSPLEAIGALVSENKHLFAVDAINFRS
jgi:aspartate aminotransferase-like enzyme